MRETDRGKKKERQRQRQKGRERGRHRKYRSGLDESKRELLSG